MIVVDSSIIVAIIREESDAAIWVDVLDKTPHVFMSVISYVETNMVIAGRWSDARLGRVDATLKALHVRVVPVTLNQGNVALAAFLRFGRGRHSAGLNIGDCFAYALAKSRDLPLLFKGDDFAKTDIVPAWRS
ncbi:MAG: type II toxin-antitoxin system VapC family toxin [Alphaproteobacteria bacterium]|nr:MAG: type II toxin-antitoxin system VapC family toxin [Alphaproteobacteria bacterium]TMJ91860.1 MAG: type II toxin-antitoxin system VapC family toxin [Alphaproteobacteria bacterium]